METDRNPTLLKARECEAPSKKRCSFRAYTALRWISQELARASNEHLEISDIQASGFVFMLLQQGIWLCRETVWPGSWMGFGS